MNRSSIETIERTDPYEAVVEELLLFGNGSVNDTDSSGDTVRYTVSRILNDSDYEASTVNATQTDLEDDVLNNWWAMLASILVVATAAGNILVCLAIAWEKRLQNVTNYFLTSLAITDLMIAILVMPLGILTLVRGYFPLSPKYCLAWICLDVLFCTASIMHLCTISVDRYLSLRYPMKLGRNKTNRRVALKIIIVWILSVAMSLPLSLMYMKEADSLLVNGTCQIPDPLYKLIGSIICFYIPMFVMLLISALTVRLLAQQRQNIGGSTGWSSGWLGVPQGSPGGLERRGTWKRLLPSKSSGGSGGTPQHTSAASTDTELTNLDTHELWLPETEPPPSAMSVLHAFGTSMLKLSRGIEGIASPGSSTPTGTPRSTPQHSVQHHHPQPQQPLSQHRCSFRHGSGESATSSASGSRTSLSVTEDPSSPTPFKHRRRGSFYNESHRESAELPRTPRKRSFSFHEQSSFGQAPAARKDSTIDETGEKKFHEKQETETIQLPTQCTCPYFGESSKKPPPTTTGEITMKPISGKNLESSLLGRNNSIRMEGAKNYEITNTVVTWEGRRRSSLSSTRTSIVGSKATPWRRAATMRAHNGAANSPRPSSNLSSPSPLRNSGHVRSHHSRTSSVISRNSSRHGRIIKLEQKATKVLCVIFFTFVFLWAPFFVLNLVLALFPDYERQIDRKIFDLVTWLGYASSMVNPIFYTIFNKDFRQAFKKVILCRYRTQTWRSSR